MDALRRGVLIAYALALAVIAIAWASGAYAHDDPWYKQQMMNPETASRLGVQYKSCCDAGDHYRTRFRLVNDGSKYGTETYEYMKDGKWKLVPPDIIQRKPTPDGQPVLFINKHDGRELCFIIDKEGI
jgi:hypothetical protein